MHKFIFAGSGGKPLKESSQYCYKDLLLISIKNVICAQFLYLIVCFDGTFVKMYRNFFYITAKYFIENEYIITYFINGTSIT